MVMLSITSVVSKITWNNLTGSFDFKSSDYVSCSTALLLITPMVMNCRDKFEIVVFKLKGCEILVSVGSYNFCS